MKVTCRFKGLDLNERVLEELSAEVCNIVQEAVIKIISKKKKCKEAKWRPFAFLYWQGGGRTNR